MKEKNKLNEFDFFSNILNKIFSSSFVEGISIFHCLNNKGIIKNIIQKRGLFISESEEIIYFEKNLKFKNSLISFTPFKEKLGNCQFYYYPYEIKGASDLSRFKNDNIIFFRFEVFNNSSFKMNKILKVIEIIKEEMENFYIVDFNLLRNHYSKNINSASKIGEIFALSLRTEDNYKNLISGIQKYFGFDRIRFYIVKENKKRLVGSYSVEVSGKVKSIDYDKILLEPGAHRFSDIVLGRDLEHFSKHYGDCVFYLPLRTENGPLGLLIFDNLLSQTQIKSEEIELLKSFSGQIAMVIDNINLFNKIEELSLYDELTSLPLRRYFNTRFQEEFYRAERFNQPLSMIWIDIDYFKQINDTYGHQIGDVALKEVSKVIMTTLRKIDFPCRYGGDEIVIMLPQAKPIEAYNLAKRLSNEIKNIRINVEFSSKKEISLTTSMGISSYPEDASTMEELLVKADEALYWVKSKGRDGLKTYEQVVKEKEEKNNN